MIKKTQNIVKETKELKWYKKIFNKKQGNNTGTEEQKDVIYTENK